VQSYVRLSKNTLHSVTTRKMRALYAVRTTWRTVATNVAMQYVQVTSVVLYSHIIKTVRMLYVGFVMSQLTES
jgi:hypothetical protein